MFGFISQMLMFALCRGSIVKEQMCTYSSGLNRNPGSAGTLLSCTTLLMKSKTVFAETAVWQTFLITPRIYAAFRSLNTLNA